jgi:hypothetical protein
MIARRDAASSSIPNHSRIFALYVLPFSSAGQPIEPFGTLARKFHRDIGR